MDIFSIVLITFAVLQLIAMVWAWSKTTDFGLGLVNRILVCIFWPVLFIPFNVQ